MMTSETWGEAKVGSESGAKRRCGWVEVVDRPRKQVKERTYRIANFLGLRLRMGKRVKQMTKRARAARLRPPKRRRRSQRLTVECGSARFLEEVERKPY